jgi:hypothetical protein
VNFSSYTFEIDATGNSNLCNGIKWLQSKPQCSYYCILHDKNDGIVPTDLRDQICYLNPQHEPHCCLVHIFQLSTLSTTTTTTTTNDANAKACNMYSILQRPNRVG